MSNHQPKILTVDDEAFNLKLLVRHLEKQGLTEIGTASNGVEALKKLHEEDFDLILLDIEMPEMDGIATLETIKSDMKLRDIPVIMISGVEAVDSIVKCIELGAEDYLSKPFNPIMLRARVNASLEKKHLRDIEGQHLTLIKSEKKKSDQLLNVILPASAASELKATGKIMPRSYDNAAILFCDIVDFTNYCSTRTADDVVGGLQEIFIKFEEITRNHQMEKIKTIGDEFMASAGLTVQNPNPLLSAVKCGLDMVEATKYLATGWEVRVGVHTGPVVAGIVGDEKYQFDVWGDTVNTASRLAGLGAPGALIMAFDSWLQIQDECEGRSLGQIDVKGKGAIELVECTSVI